jgi:predicted transcriptional regulator
MPFAYKKIHCRQEELAKMTANLLSVCPAHSLAVQKQLSNYKNTKETTQAYSLCSEMLHSIRYNKDLNAPKCANIVLDWFISKTESIHNSKENIYNKVYGITFANMQKIADDMDVSLSTIEKGFAWLKKMGFIKTRRTKGTAYKVFEAVETVAKIIKNYIKALFKCIKDSVTGQSTGLFTGHFTGLKSEQTPCESKDESPKNAEHIKAFKEDPLNKTYYKSINRIENDVPPNKVFKKFGINKDLATALENNLFFKAYNEQTQNKVASKIQLAFIKSKSDFKDQDCIDTAFETLRQCILQYEKHPENVRKDFYGALYGAMYKELMKLKQPQQEATGQPQQRKKKPKGFFGMLKTHFDQQQEPARENVIEYNENGQVMDAQPQPQKDLYSEFCAEIEQDIENMTKTAPQPVRQPKKPIRTELLPDWFDKQTREIQEREEKRKAEQPKVDVEEEKKKIRAMFAELGIKNKSLGM